MTFTQATKQKENGKAAADQKKVQQKEQNGLTLSRHQSPFPGSIQRKKSPVNGNWSIGSRSSLPGRMQAKVKISEPNDKYEKEADAMADKVMSMPAKTQTVAAGDQPGAVSRKPENSLLSKITPLTQRKEEEVQNKEEEEVQEKSQTSIQTKTATAGSEAPPSTAQRMCSDCSKNEDVQTMLQPMADEAQSQTLQSQIDSVATPNVQTESNSETARGPPDSFESSLNSSKGGGSPLPDETQRDMGSSFGADFSNVRVHTDSNAVQMNQQIGAQAFTHGRDIYFNQGKYSPGTNSGKRLLAHELTHTVQQGAVLRPYRAQMKAEETGPIQRRAGPDLTPLIQSPSIQREELSEEEMEDLRKQLSESGGERRRAIDPAPAQNAKKEAQKPNPDEVEIKVDEKLTEEQKVDKDLKEDKETVEPEKESTEGVKEKADSSLGDTGKDLENDTSDVCANAEKKTTELAENEKTHETGEEKQKNTDNAVVPPADEGQQLSNGEQVEKLDNEPEPQPDEGRIKRDMESAISAGMPSDIDDMNKFKSRGEGEVIGEKVMKSMNKDIDDVQNTYNEVNTVPAPKVPEKEPEPLPEIEVAPATAEMNLGKNAVTSLHDSHKDTSPFTNEASDIQTKEKISDDLLNMVDGDNDLTKARKEKETLQKKAVDEPKRLDKEHQDGIKKVETDMLDKEKKARKDLEKERKDKLEGTKKDQDKTKTDLEKKREKVTKDIEKIYNDTKKKVDKRLKSLDEENRKEFDREQKRLSIAFEKEVDRKVEAWKDDRYSGWLAGLKWLKDKLFGIAHFPEIERIFTNARNNFVKGIDKVVKKITKKNNKVIADCKKELKNARKKIKEYVDNLGPELKDIGNKAMGDMQKKLDELDKGIDKKKEELTQKLCAKKKQAIKDIDKKIEAMKEEMSGLVNKLGNLLLDALIKFLRWGLEKLGFSPDRLFEIIEKSKKVIRKIADDPIAFIKNLFKAVKKGIDLFGANIKKHLINGMISWLTGSAGKMDLELPEKWDLQGMATFGLSLLGLTWPNFRTKLVKRMGEPAVEAVETGLEVVQTIRKDGVKGLWQWVKEKANDIKTSILETIRNWLIENLVKAAIKKLITTLAGPWGAVLEAILTIWNLIMFFVDNLERIMSMVTSIFDTIGPIAFGKIGEAAAKVENAMGMTVPIILDFLAKLIGLGKITDAMTKVIEKIRKPVDKVVNKALDFIQKKAKSFFKGKGKDKNPRKVTSESEVMPDERKKHKQYVEEIKKAMMAKASKPLKSFNEAYADRKALATKLEKKYQPKLTKGIKVKIALTSKAEDAKDNDVDFKVTIKPNDSSAEGAFDVGDIDCSANPTTEKEKLACADKVKQKLDKLDSNSNTSDLEQMIKQIEKDHSIFEIDSSELANNKSIVKIKDKATMKQLMSVQIKPILWTRDDIDELNNAQIRKTNVKWSTANVGGTNTGIHMIAEPLGIDHPRGAESSGKLKSVMSYLIQSGSNHNKYIRGHLLNAELGGPNEDRNLFPITASANKLHESTVEHHAKKLVNTQKLYIRYEVAIKNISFGFDGGTKRKGQNFVNSIMKCKIETLKVDGTKDTVVDNTITSIRTKDSKEEGDFNEVSAKCKEAPEYCTEEEKRKLENVDALTTKESEPLVDIYISNTNDIKKSKAGKVEDAANHLGLSNFDRNLYGYLSQIIKNGSGNKIEDVKKLNNNSADYIRAIKLSLIGTSQYSSDCPSVFPDKIVSLYEYVNKLISVGVVKGNWSQNHAATISTHKLLPVTDYYAEGEKKSAIEHAHKNRKEICKANDTKENGSPLDSRIIEIIESYTERKKKVNNSLPKKEKVETLIRAQNKIGSGVNLFVNVDAGSLTKINNNAEALYNITLENQSKNTVPSSTWNSDLYEQQADRVADRIVAGNVSTPLAASISSFKGKPQKKCAACEKEEKNVQKKCNACGAAPKQTNLESSLLSSKGSGSKLGEKTQTEMESGFGADFSGVRIHTGTKAEQMSQSIGARAFTHGNDIYFNSGQYNPESREGKHLLAHELTHTVQQGAAKPKVQAQRGPPSRGSPSIQKKDDGTKQSIQRRAGPEVSQTAGGPFVQRGLWDSVTGAAGAVWDSTVGAVVDAAGEVISMTRDMFWSLLSRVASPTLVSLIREISNKGIFGFLKEKITSSLSSIFSGLTGNNEALQSLFDTFGSFSENIISIIEALASGDCGPLFAALDKFKGIISGIAGDAWNGIKNFFAPVGDFFSNLWSNFGAPVLDWLKETASDVWTYIKDLGKNIWEWTSPVRSVAGSAWDWLKETIGIGESEGGDSSGGIIGWISGKAQEVWDSVKQELSPVIEPVMQVANKIKEFLPMTTIMNLKEKVLGWSNKVNQMGQRMSGDDNGMNAEGQASLRGEILPAVMDTINNLSLSISSAGVWVSGIIGDISTKVNGFIGSLTSVPLLAPLRSGINWLKERADAIAAWAREKVIVLFKKIGEGLKYLSTFIEPILNVLRKIADVLGDILGKFPDLIMGPFWWILPECIKNPIKDFFMKTILSQIPFFGQLVAAGDIWTKVKNTALTILTQIFVDGDLFMAIWTFFKSMLSLIGIPPELVTNIIVRASQAFTDILTDPVGFIINILKSIKLGFTNFFSNILRHLAGGVVDWLFGQVAEAGIEIPQDFSLRSILKFVFDILGISVEKIWRLLGEKIGPERVERLRRYIRYATGVFEWVVVAMTEGPAGVWNRLVSQLNNLWSMVIGQVVSFITTRIISKATQWIMSLLDVSGITPVINSLIAVWNAIQSFAQNVTRILQIINSVVNGIADMAAGNIEPAANYLEEALSGAIPVIISFLAGQFGLNSIGSRMRSIIGSVQRTVEDALRWLINRTVDGIGSIANYIRNLAARAGGAVRRGANAVRDALFPRKRFRVGNESHTIHVSGGNRPTLMIASTPQPIVTFLNNLRSSPEVPDEKKRLIPGIISKANTVQQLIERADRDKKANRDVTSQMRTILEKENELANDIRSVWNYQDPMQTIEKYRLEGTVATYGTMPRARFDRLTPDHQPQASILRYAARLPEFAGAHIQQVIRGSHVDGGAAINLFDKRHEAGRTYGSKGNTTSQEAQTDIETRRSQLPANDYEGRRNAVVGVLRNELQKDVREMNTVANNDASYNDIDGVQNLTADQKRELKNSIKSRILAGENRISYQNLDRLKNGGPDNPE